MRGEMEFRRVIIERETLTADQLSPLFSSFLSIRCLFPPRFPVLSSSFAITFIRGNGYVFLGPNASFSYSVLGRANETTRYYYAAADPCKQ